MGLGRRGQWMVPGRVPQPLGWRAGFPFGERGPLEPRELRFSPAISGAWWGGLGGRERGSRRCWRESSATRFRNQLGLNPPSSVRVWPSEPSRSWSCACRGRHGPGRRTIYQLPGPRTSRLYSSAIALAIPLGMDIDIFASSFWDGVSLNPTQNLYSF